MRKFNFLFTLVALLSTTLAYSLPFIESNSPVYVLGPYKKFGAIAGAGVLNLTSAGTQQIRGVRYRYFSNNDCTALLGSIFASAAAGAPFEDITGPRSLTFIPKAVFDIGNQFFIATNVHSITYQPLTPAITDLFTPGTSKCFVLDCSSGTQCNTSTDEEEVTFAN